MASSDLQPKPKTGPSIEYERQHTQRVLLPQRTQRCFNAVSGLKKVATSTKRNRRRIDVVLQTLNQRIQRRGRLG